jgi:hypothetical protein
MGNSSQLDKALLWLLWMQGFLCWSRECKYTLDRTALDQLTDQLWSSSDLQDKAEE